MAEQFGSSEAMYSCARNSRFSAARRTLEAAEMGVYGYDVLSEATFATKCFGEQNAAFAAATRWIRSGLVGGRFSAETAIVSSFKLPMTACEEPLAIMNLDEYPVTCNM